MEIPQVEIPRDQDLHDTFAAVMSACQEAGLSPEELHWLNEFFYNHYQFLRIFSSGVSYVYVVATGPWLDDPTRTLVAVLIQLRFDPEPAGSRVRFRILSAYPAPSYVEGLFGDGIASDFECRAALGCQFRLLAGPEDLPRFDAKAMPRLGAVAIHLLREILSVEVRPGDAASLQDIDRVLTQDLSPQADPSGERMLTHTVVVLGSLLGEMLCQHPGYHGEWLPGNRWPQLSVRYKESGRQVLVNPIRKAWMRSKGEDPVDLSQFCQDVWACCLG